ncbi:MAG: MFS transporter, partial [Actinomycetota bacterium]
MPTAKTVLGRNPDFARLYVAALISYAGDWFAAVALLGLVLETTGRASLAGLLLATSTLPFALMSVFAGVIADRVDRRKLMVVADLLRAGVALGFLAARTGSTIWIGFACNGLLSAISPLFEPASSAAMPNLVRTEDLARANVLMGAAWGTMLAVGAAIGGLVATTLGRDTAFLMNAASFVASAILIASIRGKFREFPREPHHVTIFEDIAVAVRFARTESR